MTVAKRNYNEVHVFSEQFCGMVNKQAVRSVQCYGSITQKQKCKLR